MSSEDPKPALPPVDPRESPFSRLGFPAPQFALDDKALERAWLERSRKVHPDRFATRPDIERRRAAEHTVALNEAYRALKDPYDRALWLVRHGGIDTAALDQAFLVELMELREEAEDSDEARERVLVRARARFHEAAALVKEKLSHEDARADGYTRPNDALRHVARLLAEMKTLARLVDDLSPHSAAGKLISTLDGR